MRGCSDGNLPEMQALRDPLRLERRLMVLNSSRGVSTIIYSVVCGIVKIGLLLHRDNLRTKLHVFFYET